MLGDKKLADALVLSKAISIEDFEKIVGDLSEAAAMVKIAAATREVAKLNLDFTEVKSPISGQISRAMVTVGNMVASGETGGTVLTTIMSTDPMYAYFDVDDQTWVRIREQLRKSNLGLPAVQLGLSNEKGFPHVGKLDFIDNEVDAGTGTLPWPRPLPKQGPHAHSRPVRARSAPSANLRPALLVTDRAIDTDQGQKILYVVNRNNNMVEKRVVTLGRLHDGLREIVSGLAAGEQIIIEGIQRSPGNAGFPEPCADARWQVISPQTA